jgi:ankyrin repeat protein
MQSSEEFNGRARIPRKPIANSSSGKSVIIPQEMISIHKAAHDGDLKALNLLIKNNADINQADKEGDTAIHIAIREKQVLFVKELLAQKPDVNKRDANGRTALHLAVEKKRETILEELLACKGIDLNAKDRKGRTAVHLAIERDQEHVLEMLVATDGIIIDEPDKQGNSALYTALESKHASKAQLIKILIQAGADPDYLNSKTKSTPRSLADKLDKNLLSLFDMSPQSTEIQPKVKVQPNIETVPYEIQQEAIEESTKLLPPVPQHKNLEESEQLPDLPSQPFMPIPKQPMPVDKRYSKEHIQSSNALKPPALPDKAKPPLRRLPSVRHKNSIKSVQITDLHEQDSNINKLQSQPLKPAPNRKPPAAPVKNVNPIVGFEQAPLAKPAAPLQSPLAKVAPLVQPVAAKPIKSSSSVEQSIAAVQPKMSPLVVKPVPAPKQIIPIAQIPVARLSQDKNLAANGDVHEQKNNVAKKRIKNDPYGINFKETDNHDFLVESQATALMAEKKSMKNDVKSSNAKETIQKADLDELHKRGYTDDEVNSFLNLGITPLALHKLINTDLKLDIFQSIEVIMTCIQMGRTEAEKVKTQDHDLVNIIGNTGAGKSTSVNYFHGCEMEKRTEGYSSQIVVKADSKVKEVVAIGHGKSKTFIPSVVPSPQNNIAFCDAPGFSDNRGQEVNISNAVNIRHTIENAKSVKIILLIDYKTIRESRGNGINGLIKTLDNLFGVKSNSLADNAASILIGVTQVPKILDDEVITLANVRGLLTLNERVPANIINHVMIIDPLERRADEKCARVDWIEAIKKLNPVKDHKNRFNTVLNAEDELMLIDISKEISKQVNKDLADGKYSLAAKKLEQMHYLKIIRREQIDRLYNDNLREVDAYTAGVERKIRKLADGYNWSDAYKSSVEYQQFVLMFNEVIPTLNDSFIKIVLYVNDKRIQQRQENLQAAVLALASSYDQDRVLQKRVAFSLHDLLNLSEPAIKDKQATQYLGGFLRSIWGFECEPLGKCIEDLSNRLNALKQLADKLNKKLVLAEAEAKVVKELQRIAESASRIHRENSIEKLKNMNIIVLEQLEKLKAKSKWETNGKNILNILNPLQENLHADQVIKLLSELLKDPSVKVEAELLHKQLLEAKPIIASITTVVLGQAEANDIPPLAKLVNDGLCKIKAQLSAAKKEEELKIQKDKEQKDVENTIQDLKSIIENNDSTSLKGILDKIAKFSAEQQSLMNKNKDLSILLTEKLQVNIDLIKLKVTWEANGPKFLEVTKDFRAPTNLNQLEKIFSSLKTFPEAKASAEIMYYMMVFLGIVNGKLPLDINVYVKAAETHLSHIQVELKKRQAEEEKRLNEDRKRNEARDLVARINNQLLPNSKFEELNVAISRLIQIAPEHVNTITLKTKIDELSHGFHDQLTASNYDAVKGTFSLLAGFKKHLNAVLTHMGIKLELNEFTAAILKHISDAVAAVQSEMLEAFADDVIANPKHALKTLPKLGAYFNAVGNFKDINGVDALTNTMVASCIQVLNGSTQRHANSTDAVVYAKLLMQIQCLSSVIGSSSPSFTVSIRTTTGHLIQKRADVDFIGAVAHVLLAKAEEKSDGSRYAEEVINQYPEFKRAEVKRFIGQTSNRTANDILKELQIETKDNLKRCYDIYFQEYEHIITEIVSKFEKPDDQQVLTTAISKAQSKARELQSTTHYSKHPESVATMIANIFGVWTYLDAHSGGFKSDRNTLRQPHASQAMSVMLLFGMDRSNESVKNHLLQVKTGEGKSVITAAAAIAFALLGYEVHVACYNPWLARRDERDFNKLFNQFDLVNVIKYGDFSYHVDQLITRMGDLRALGYQLIKGENAAGKQTKNENTILFVDEVDVFFSESFLGGAYNPAQLLTSHSYRDLLIDIWNQRTTYLAMSIEQFTSAIVAHALYKAFTTEFTNAVSLMQPFLVNMYQGLTAVNSGAHQYICTNEQIGYVDKVANTIRTNTHWGHYTAFAAIKEYQSKRVSDANLNYCAAMSVICGKFSYAELPSSYKIIVGVTGTLFSLSAFESKLLENYNIKRKTAIPSVFIKQKLEGAENVLAFAGDINAEDDQGYFHNIKKLVNAAIAKDRAVLLVFETEARLNDYKKFIINHPYSVKTIRTNTLLTATNDQTRDLMVAEAAGRSRVTEMVREFARGTDFVCRDSQLRKSGGVLVIGGFFPEHEAEEVQMKGRTCRQIDPGGFQMVLYLDDLKKYGIQSLNELDQAQSKYQFLSQKRNDFQAKKAAEIQANLEKAKADHQQTLKLAELLTNHSIFTRLVPGKKDDKQAEALEIIRKFNA